MKRKVNVILKFDFDILPAWKNLNLCFILGRYLQMDYERYIKTLYPDICKPRFASLALLHNTEQKVVKQLILQHFISSCMLFYKSIIINQQIYSCCKCNTES